MATVVGVSSPRSTKAPRSSRSWAFLSSGHFDVRPGLSSIASVIGTAVLQIRASHQKLVSGARKTHIKPRTKRYKADCQLTHEGTSRFGGAPCAPGARLAPAFGDWPS
jgi:hypothetical protein